MRRVLGHGSFLRFYLLLGLALCVVFFIALGGRSFIEQIRREDYREQLAALPMSLMTQQLASSSVAERETIRSPAFRNGWVCSSHLSVLRVWGLTTLNKLALSEARY